MTERTAEEWCRLAVSLPGWRWMPGMLVVDTASNPAYRFTGRAWDDGGVVSDDGDGLNLECICRVEWPDPDDPATAGALLALLGPGVVTASSTDGSRVGVEGRSFGAGVSGRVFGTLEDTIGRACIAAAEALGRWPGGGE